VGVLESTFAKHRRNVAALLDQREVPLSEAGAEAGGASVGKTLVGSRRGLDAAVSSIANRRDRAEKGNDEQPHLCVEVPDNRTSESGSERAAASVGADVGGGRGKQTHAGHHLPRSHLTRTSLCGAPSGSQKNMIWYRAVALCRFYVML